MLVDGQPNSFCAFMLFQPLDSVLHGGVFNTGDQDAVARRFGVVAGPEQALDGEVVGLGAAGGENDFGGVGTGGRGNGFAGCFHCGAGTTARSVERGRIAATGNNGGECGEGRGRNRRGRRVI